MGVNLAFNTAVHVLAFLTKHQGEKHNSQALAEKVCVNPVQIRRVMSQLHQHGYVEVKRGNQGGYYITQKGMTAKLSLLFELFNQPESHIRLFIGDTAIECEISQQIGRVMYKHYLEEQNILAQYYQNISIQDILNDISMEV
ncbi:RrF2 family transcriptional regulator [Staphylococcus felis]|uniref:RrF2 family transcriptional regulator n=1 Tax=Staphylococcus felis TaxID=46127 RepID=UPI001F4DCD64|nr:Rrf2 family transcriptional regulator [Staphylococcus felis]